MITLKGEFAEFRFFRPHARAVNLVGDFNHWHHHSMPMRRDADGWWTARLRLSAGTYRFRYMADGDWFVDYAGFGVQHGPFGLDGIVQIEERPRKTAAACQECPHAVEAA